MIKSFALNLRNVNFLSLLKAHDVYCLLMLSVLVLFSEIEHMGCRLFQDIPSGPNSGFKVSISKSLNFVLFSRSTLYF